MRDPAPLPPASGDPAGTAGGEPQRIAGGPADGAIGGTADGTARAAAGLAAAVLLALAAVFAAIVAANPGHSPTAGVDGDWLSLVRSTRDVVLTDAAKVIGYVAGPFGGSVIAVGVALFLWFVRGRRMAAVFLAITPAVASGASQLIKHLVLRARPGGGLVSADAGSFPSGHVITTIAVGLALTLVLARPGHRRIPLICVAVAAVVMAWCRTYLGVHWISDTLESFFVATGLVLALWAILGPRIERAAVGGGGYGKGTRSTNE